MNVNRELRSIGRRDFRGSASSAPQGVCSLTLDAKEIRVKTSSARVASPVSRPSVKKTKIVSAENLRDLCAERLTLVRDYTDQPENREAIGAALEANRLAQKLVRRSPAAVARSARAAALAKAAG
jgi:hypothetical protein